jgi:hypothetical protein
MRSTRASRACLQDQAIPVAAAGAEEADEYETERLPCDDGGESDGASYPEYKSMCGIFSVRYYHPIADGSASFNFNSQLQPNST